MDDHPPAFSLPPAPPDSGRRRRPVVALLVAVAVLVPAGLAVLFRLDDGGDEDPSTVASEISSTIEELTATGGPATVDLDATAGSEVAEATVAASESDTSVFELTVGTCFNDPRTTTEIQTVGVVPCDVPHDNEVFALVEYPAGPNAAYPGREPLTNLAEEECRGTAFSDYVGIDWQDSRFDTSQLTPTEESWAEGDREIVCLLYDIIDGPVTGSARGEGR